MRTFPSDFRLSFSGNYYENLDTMNYAATNQNIFYSADTTNYRKDFSSSFISAAYSTTSGDSYTATRNGVIMLHDFGTVGTDVSNRNRGFSVNATGSDLTTDIRAVSESTTKATYYTYSAGSDQSWQVIAVIGLNAGDVIRFHGDRQSGVSRHDVYCVL